ncbi:mitochondrial dynamin GTPase Msp1 [Ascochyta clinopodiicola]|nr:mitochondrial dynamin GTPase Msp1 [Ascochyta clinopodiicola]
MASNKKSSLTGYLPDILMAAAAPLIAYFVIRNLLARLDPDAQQKEEARAKSAAATRKLDAILTSKRRKSHGEYDSEDEDGDSRNRRPRMQELVLNSYEQTIAMEVVAPEEIPVTFDDIGGLDSIIEELKESVIYPLTMPHLYSHSSSLLSAPSGVLLYGPPGCGKTMLAKALAHESGACFINLHISTLTEKWYGDSNKLVNAVFSLARKLQPSIVFIDEIDAVLGQRRSGEHEASGMVKAEFMTHWDGLASSTASGSSTPQRICILGATNRIQDIDEAILRRMPKKFPVALPNASQRSNIFSLILRGTKIDSKNLDLDYLVRVSAGMSGSDIKEACRDAAMGPVREYIRRKKADGTLKSSRGVRDEDVRGLRTEDFFGRGKGLREMESLDETREEMNARSRRIHTTSESSEEASSADSTTSGDEKSKHYDDPEPSAISHDPPHDHSHPPPAPEDAWKTTGVRVIPADSLEPVGGAHVTPGMDRSAAINFARVGAQKLWAGTVHIHAGAKTGAHHHGHLESVIYVLKGRARMRWGEKLEFTAEAGPGDFIFVPPYVPHQEINASDEEKLECVLMRSDSEAVAINLPGLEVVEKPENVKWIDPTHPDGAGA